MKAADDSSPSLITLFNTLLDIIMLRRRNWLAAGAELDRESASTARSYRNLLLPMIAPLLALAWTEPDPVWARYGVFALCIAGLLIWPYYATLVRGYSMNRPAGPVTEDETRGARTFRLLQDHLDNLGWMIRLTAWVLAAACLFALSDWIMSVFD